MTNAHIPPAVVCGTSTAVGVALVERMHTAGIPVIGIDLPGEAAHPAAILQLNGDITHDASWQGFARRLEDAGLRPGALVYAISETESQRTLAAMDQTDWDRVIERSLRGAFLACQHIFPLMHTPGAVVLLASVYANWDSRADQLAVSASGGGLLALTRSLALNGAPQQIRVNTVCYDTALAAWFATGSTRTTLLERTPLGHATSPADIVDAIMFFLSEDAGYLTGSSLVVDGGQTLQSWSNAGG